MGMVTEPKQIAEERKALQNQLNTMRKAQQVLKRDPTLAGLQAEIRDEQVTREAAIVMHNAKPDAVISMKETKPEPKKKKKEPEPEPKPEPVKAKAPERERQPYGNAPAAATPAPAPAPAPAPKKEAPKKV